MLWAATSPWLEPFSSRLSVIAGRDNVATSRPWHIAAADVFARRSERTATTPAVAKELFHRGNVAAMESKMPIALILAELHDVMAHAGR